MRHFGKALRFLAPLAIAVAATIPFTASALQFTRVVPNLQSPSVSDIGRDGTTLYARASERVFVSTDGVSWKQLAPQPPIAAARLAVGNGSVYVIGGVRELGPAKIFAKTGTAGWKNITGDLSDIQDLQTAGNSVFVTTARTEGGNFVYRLWRGNGTNSTWTQVTPTGVDFIGDIIKSGPNLCLGVGNGGIRYTTDNGASWKNSGLSGNLGVMGVSNDGANVLVGSASNSFSVRRSVNNCASFTTLPSFTTPLWASLQALGVAPDGSFYAGFSNGNIYKSINSGSTFVLDNSGDLPEDTGVTIQNFTSYSGAMYANGGAGLETNASGTWKKANKGITAGFYNGLYLRGSGPNALGAAMYGVWTTEDVGVAAFKERSATLTQRNMADVISRGSIVIASSGGVSDTFGGGAHSEIGLFRSTNNGNTFTPLTNANGLPPGASVDDLADDGTVMYANISFADVFADRGIYASADAGASWSKLTSATLTNKSLRNMATRNGKLFVYLGGDANTVYVSPDHGVTFNPAGSGLSGQRFGKIFAFSGGLIASAGGVVYRSVNDGTSWTPTTGFAVDMFGIEILSLAEDAAGVLYLGDEHAGLSVSTDGGVTWKPDSDGLPVAEVCIPRIQALQVLNGKVYAAMGGPGLYVADVLGSQTPGDSVECTTDTDHFPSNFSFADQNNVAPNRKIQSNTVTITGMAVGATAPITVKGGTYSIGCTGTFVSAPGTIANNQTVCVQHKSAATGETAVSTTLTVGLVASATFTSRTGLVFTGGPDQIRSDWGTGGFGTSPGMANGTDVLVLSSGRVVAAGGFSGFTADLGMTMFKATGEVDTAWGTNGVAKLDSGGSDYAVSILQLTSGKFMLVGYAMFDNGTPQNGIDDYARIVLGRVTATGQPDGTFGTNGVKTFSINPSQENRAEIAVDAELTAGGDVIVSGYVQTNSNGVQFWAVKFSPDGDADTTFGVDNPTLWADGVAAVQAPSAANSAQMKGLTILNGGKILMVGQTFISFSQLGGVAIRLNADGTPDPGFGTSGVASTGAVASFGDSVGIGGSKLILVGQGPNPYAPAVVRLLDNGSLDTSYDGDGVKTFDTLSGAFAQVIKLSSGSLALLGSARPAGTSDNASMLYSVIGSLGAVDNGFGTNGYVLRGPVNGSAVGGVSMSERADGGVVVGGSYGGALGTFVFGGT